jgi:hypothetical protein
MDKQEMINKLKKYYNYNLFSENYMRKIVIISAYTDNELRNSFYKNDIIASYLEFFLLRCYKAKIELETIDKKELYKVVFDDSSKHMLDLELEYLELLTEFADYFEKIGINSKAKNYYDNYKIASYYLKECRNEIRYLEADFKDKHSKKIIYDCKKRLLENSSGELLEAKNIFLEQIVDACEYQNMDNLNNTFLLYSDKKIEIENLMTPYYNKALKESIIKISKIFKDTGNRLKMLYNLYLRYLEISNNYWMQIMHNERSYFTDYSYFKIKK